MRVILHIGTEKTASTALQDFVYANRERLRRHGVALSDQLGKTNNRKLAAYCMPSGNFDDYFKDLRISTAQERQAHFADFREAFLGEARRIGHWAHTLFVTSEHFHSRLRDVESIQRLKAVLDEVAGEVVVLCYFREQSAVVQSLYSTAIKSGNVTDLASFSRRCVPKSHYYNYFQFFAKWRDVFGAERLRARLYAKDAFTGGDIRKDLLSLLIDGPDFDEFEYATEYANRSLGRVGLELGRLTNMAFGRYNPDGSMNEVRQRLIDVLSKSELGSLGRLRFTEAQRIYERFEGPNTRFAAEFLGCKGNPFPRPARPRPTGADRIREDFVPLGPLLAYYAALLEALEEMPQSLNAACADAIRGEAMKLRRGEQVGGAGSGRLLDLAGALQPKRPSLSSRLRGAIESVGKIWRD